MIDFRDWCANSYICVEKCPWNHEYKDCNDWKMSFNCKGVSYYGTLTEFELLVRKAVMENNDVV